MEKRLLQFAMCGYWKNINPYEVANPINRQRILLLINEVSLRAEEIAKRLNLSLEEVERDLAVLKEAGLIKEVNGRFSPNIAIFTLKDYEILKLILKDLSAGIEKIVEKRVNEVRALIRNLEYARRGLDFPDVEYIIVGAITLDYEGLEVLRDEGLIIISKEMPGGGRYVFAGFEWPIKLEESWMWGHNDVTPKGYWFSTHGKLPPEGPRMAFPDIAFAWSACIGQEKTLEKLDMIGEILELLSTEDLSIKDLSEKTRRSEAEIMMEISLLWVLDYVVPIIENSKHIKWRINRPFFTTEDLKKIKELSRTILREIVEFIKNRLPEIKETYAKTFPSKNGIRLEEAFNLLYHAVFEEALNSLIEKRVIHEPPVRIDGGKYSPFICRQAETITLSKSH